MVFFVFWGCYFGVVKLVVEMNLDNILLKLWGKEVAV